MMTRLMAHLVTKAGVVVCSMRCPFGLQEASTRGERVSLR
jgi:hypothetical protein